MSGYRDLEVFQKAYQFALEIHRLSQDFPDFERFSLTRQIRESSKSIAVNIAEGYGKRILSGKEFKRFLLMSIGSCDETKVWLDFVKDLNYLSSEKYGKLMNLAEEIGKMLYGLWKKVKD